MLFLTDEAKIICNHTTGRVKTEFSQDWVKIAKHPILIDSDPENRTISGCPNYGVGIKPCQRTLKVREGYSEFIRINNRPVALDSLSGLTDGTPPGVVKYKVVFAGQEFVSEKKK